jgi:hypothetical protein
VKFQIRARSDVVRMEPLGLVVVERGEDLGMLFSKICSGSFARAVDVIESTFAFEEWIGRIVCRDNGFERCW